MTRRRDIRTEAIAAAYDRCAESLFRYAVVMLATRPPPRWCWRSTYQDALRAAERRWPEPLHALSPAGQRANQPPRPSDRVHLAETIRFWARSSQMVRCVRLRVDATLKLVDPYTGRLLELGNCRL